MKRPAFYSLLIAAVVLSCTNVKTDVKADVKTDVKADIKTEGKPPACDETQTFSKVSMGAGNEVTWTVNNDCAEAVYELKEFRWNKWVALGEVNSKGIGSNDYTFSVDNTCDLYNVRIELKGSRKCRSPKVETSDPKFITFNPHGKTHLLFSGSTRYEVYTGEGKRILNGCAQKVDVSKLKSGAYYLNYGNKMTRFLR